MSNVICFIPARQGSSLKDKNIRDLGGKPLLCWSIEEARDAGIEKIIVNSNSEEYLEIAKSYGAETMLRPSHLAKDKTSMLELLTNEIPKIKPVPEMVLLMQPTTPFRSTMRIRLAISLLEKNQEYKSLISVEKVPEKYNPYQMIIQSSSGNRVIFRKLIGRKEKWQSLLTGKKFVGPNLSGYPISQRMTGRQDLNQCWIPDGSIYLFYSENLKRGSIYGEKTLLLEGEGTLNINSKEDFELAAQYLKDKQKNGSI